MQGTCHQNPEEGSLEKETEWKVCDMRWENGRQLCDCEAQSHSPEVVCSFKADFAA